MKGNITISRVHGSENYISISIQDIELYHKQKGLLCST